MTTQQVTNGSAVVLSTSDGVVSQGNKSNELSIGVLLTELLAKISENDSKNQIAQLDFTSQLGTVVEKTSKKIDRKAAQARKLEKAFNMASRIAQVLMVVATAGAGAVAYSGSTGALQAVKVGAEMAGGAASITSGGLQIAMADVQKNISTLKAKVDNGTKTLSSMSSDLGNQTKISNQMQSAGTEAQGKFLGAGNKQLIS